jgi:hypothetical protein
MRKKKNTLFKVEEKEKREVEVKRYRDFSVTVVNNGFIATIGCQRLVFKTLLEVAEALKEYWNSPSKVEAEYMRNTLVSSSNEVPVPTTVSSGNNPIGSTLTLRDR